MWEAQFVSNVGSRMQTVGALTDPARPTAVTHWLTPEPCRGDHRAT
jgi:hypothetical protein